VKLEAVIIISSIYCAILATIITFDKSSPIVIAVDISAMMALDLLLMAAN
jgi:hypothetical protein